MKILEEIVEGRAKSWKGATNSSSTSSSSSLNVFKLLSKHPFKRFFFSQQILFMQKAVDISREMSFCILVHFSVQFLSVIRLFGLWIAMVSLNCTPVITTKLSRGCLETGLRSDIRGKISSDRWDITGLIFFLSAPAGYKESSRGFDPIRNGEIFPSVFDWLMFHDLYRMLLKRGTKSGERARET